MNESRYRLVRPLATGGMAELFLGVARGAEGFEKPVAIKRVLPHLAREPAIAQMFLAEARLATHLQHQNIASVYDVGSGPEGLFLVMELVNGWDVGVLLRHAYRRDQHFPPHLVAFIGAQVLAGLVHAYRRMHAGRPVLTAHRDVSPSNLLISREGEVKVTDFGIARIEGTSVGTQPGTFKGKLPYASPETLQGQPATALSDQFALGIVLYELLAGRHPFGDGAGDPMSIALAITQHEPPPLTDVPAPLAAIVSRALAKAPEARFPRPEDMAEALSRYLAQAGEPASSQALAAFLASLNLPPTLLELSESSAQPGSDPGGQARTRQSPVLPTRPVDPPSFALEIEEFDDVPGGPALSMSGRLVMPTAAAPAPVTEPRAPLRSVMDMKEEELQLTERAPRPQSDFVPIDTAEPRPRRRWGRTVALVAIPLLVLAGVVVALPQFSQQLRTLRLPHGSGAPMGMLSIQSEPAGATVTVDGTVLGKTPLAVDNTYPAQDIPVKVTLKGYKPWTGTFTGGEPVSLDVKLRK